MPKPGHFSVEIGGFTLRPFTEDSFWLEHQDGEGMQVWRHDLVELLEDYWQENF